MNRLTAKEWEAYKEDRAVKGIPRRYYDLADELIETGSWEQLVMQIEQNYPDHVLSNGHVLRETETPIESKDFARTTEKRPPK
jgi:hypothetical protein